MLGRSAASAGVFAEVAAGTDGYVLRRSGTTLGFGQVATAGITDAAVTLAKLATDVTGLMPRGWVRYNVTTNTCSPNYGVTSITRTANGVFQVNSSLTNMVMFLSVYSTDWQLVANQISANTINVYCTGGLNDGELTDPLYLHILIY